MQTCVSTISGVARGNKGGLPPPTSDVNKFVH